MAGAATPAQALELMRISVGSAQETITLSVPKAEPHKVFLVPDPERLVVDVPQVAGRHTVALSPDYKGHLLKAARFGQFDTKTSRFVFDLTGSVRVLRVRVEGKREMRIIIDIAPNDNKTPTLAATPVLPPAARVGVLRAPTMEITNSVPAFAAAKPLPAAKTQPAARPHALAKAQGRSIAEKPVIVIDPGHGGVDPGTIGIGGGQEKDVVLAFGKALRAQLLKSGHYKVVMTRDDDRFIMLRKRVEIARKAHGTLFISLHADSAPEVVASGLSVYTVSEKASDTESAQLAARENKADVLAGMDLSTEREDVASILISLAQRETKNESATFADLLVTHLQDKVHLLQNSHRFAGFAVLKAPDIPSVLVETGFLSNPQEEKQLKSAAYREKVVAGLAAGVDAYFQLKKKLGE